jgi:hypothetical protein
LTSTASLDSERVAVAVEPTERLFVPHRKRLSYSYVINEDGIRELRLDYGLKEITFDEEHLFAFGEQLVRESSFTGATATMWGPGYAWDELRPLLEALLTEGILRRGDGDGLNDPRGGGLVPSQVPRSVCPVARSWTRADCESITRALAGRPIEIGYLEAVVPMFRIAHPALDGDDRQVGEANVYPARLRLDRETEWRVCQYPGSRYRDDTPMNVTALRAMIKHWKPMLATILAVRRELHARLGAPVGPWKIGELYVLSCTILALPTFQLMKSSPPAPLHPVLSSLFRITDGIRMTTTDMLFSIEHTRRDDEPMTAAELYEFAEQHTVFIGDTGVCAGPKPLIEEFLAAVVDGVPAVGLDGLELPAEVQRLLAELPAVVDYGLLAAQSWGVALSIFPAMSRCYQAVLAILEGRLAAGHRLIERLRADWRVLTHMQLTQERDRGVHLNAYRDAYERSWPLCRTRVGQAKIAKEIAPVAETAMHAVATDRLTAILATREDLAADGVVDGVVAALMHYLREEQAVVAAATRIQEAINQLLDRPRPTRPLSVRDIHANYVMGDAASYPFLFDSLEAELGLRVECTAHAIDVTDRAAS